MATKKYIQTPRGYLSQSQVSLWLSSPDRYKALYFDDRTELRHSSLAMDYGKVIADALEKAEETGDLVSDAAMLLLPKYDIRDKEFRTDLKVEDEWVTILAKPDFMDSETKDIIEIKTGKTKWTQEKAEKHLQLLWYATAIYIEHGVIPKVKLTWVETEHVEVEIDGQMVKEVRPTGHIETFEVTYTLSDILNTMSLMGKTAKEIAIAWASHETDKRITEY